MAQTFQGDVNFELHNKTIPHRFEVTVTDENKIVIWFEDRQSKKQWQTAALQSNDFVTEDNAIPKAKIHDYAERFAACLEARNASDKYSRALTTKGSERTLVLSLPLQWALRDLTLDYKFKMNEVPLERIDILGARVRDVEDKVSSFAEDRIHRLEQENEALKSRLDAQVDRTPIFAQAVPAAAQYSKNQTLTWVAGDENANGAIEFLPTGHIQFHMEGVYALDIGVVHASASNGVIFELKQSEITLAACQGSSYKGYYATTPLRYVLKAKPGAKIHVVYKGTGNTYEGGGVVQGGSYMTITML